MKELKPCPFCGGNATYAIDMELIPYGIRCRGCRAIIRFTQIKPPRKNEKFERVMNEISEAWNKRGET